MYAPNPGTFFGGGGGFPAPPRLPRGGLDLPKMKRRLSKFGVLRDPRGL